MVKPSVDYSLYYVTGRPLLPAGQDFLWNLEQSLKGGTTIVQLREKNIDTREFLDLAREAKAVCEKYSVPLLINDRLDIALALGLSLHVGQSDFPAPLARQLLGPDAIIGVSVNNEQELDEVLSLEKGVVDYVGLGAAYGTETKKDTKEIIGPRGVRKLIERLGESEIKTVVIGGVNLPRIPNILSQTAAYIPSSNSYRPLDGIAVVSAIAAVADPKAASEELLKAWKKGWRGAIWKENRLFKTGGEKAVLDRTVTLVERLKKEGGGLVHHITNNVVTNDTANLTLSLGCSPIMATNPLEAEPLGKVLSALLINFGTLTDSQYDCMKVAGRTANGLRKKVIFDPVGVGATEFRKGLCGELMGEVKMDVIKGNAGEIAALAGSTEVQSRGVDSLGSGFKNPAKIARDLARKEKSVIVITGPIDYVSDGNVVIGIENGHQLQGLITGSGCMATTAIACFCAATTKDEDALGGAVAGILTYNIAAELAAARPDVKGPNTFRAALIDEAYNVTPEQIRKLAKIKFYDVEE